MDPFDAARELLGEELVVNQLKRRLDAALSAETTKDIYAGALKYRLEQRKEEVSAMNQEIARLKRMVKLLIPFLSPEALKEFDRMRSQGKFDPPKQEDD